MIRLSYLKLVDQIEEVSI